MEKSITHIRPRFEFVVKKPKEEVKNRISHLLTTDKNRVVGKIVDDHILLDIPPHEVHYWSPQLNFRLEADESNDAHTVIRGLIGPRPAVWTMFTFIYFSLGIFGFVTGIFGVSRWMLGTFSPLVWAIPIAFFFMLTAYGAGKYGESLGADQIETLKQFVRDALEL